MAAIAIIDGHHNPHPPDPLLGLPTPERLPLKTLPIVTLFLSLLLAPVAHALNEEDVRNSVVKIHTTQRLPNPYRPWTKLDPRELSGSGAVIEGNRILTNAHVVMYAREIYVQPYQAADRIEAKVVAVSPTMDLAILEISDKEFFKTHPALPISKGLPSLKQTVNAYGYPTGGKDLSITEGIISRIEIAAYNLGYIGVRVQVDAALNPGNSGGPAMVDGKIVGIVYSGIPSADNIGYLIPSEEVNLFLEDIADGKYDGKPHLVAGMQTAENEAFRNMLKLDASVTGVVVTEIPKVLNDMLKEWDVITHIGEFAIDNDARILVREDLRLDFRYQVPRLAKDGKVEFTVLRKGESIKINVPVLKRANAVIQSLLGEYPRFFIYGPLVFTVGTHEFVNSMGARGPAMLTAIGSPLIARLGDDKNEEDEELVAVASPMFSHKIIKGYGNPFLSVIKSVNGVKIKNLRHLVETLRSIKDDYVIFRFDDKRAEMLVFNRKEIEEATEDILNDNGIREQYSKDLRDAWVKE